MVLENELQRMNIELLTAAVKALKTLLQASEMAL
jgi:hypothetical protein